MDKKNSNYCEQIPLVPGLGDDPKEVSLHSIFILPHNTWVLLVQGRIQRSPHGGGGGGRASLAKTEYCKTGKFNDQNV